MTTASIQLDQAGRLRHLLTTEALPRAIILDILDTAAAFAAVSGRAVKKTPLLRGKTIVNLFFEPSTRTRTTFELAAKRLSADVLNIDVAASAANKGESLLDMLKTLQAMRSDMFVVRHATAGAADFIARHVAPETHIINAGDGRHAHPTQALLDMFTIRRHKPDFAALSVAIIGDIAHSRVARADIHALTTLGVRDIRVIAPQTLLPMRIESLGVRAMQRLDKGLADVDVVIVLRLQRERMSSALLPSEREYFQCFGLTRTALQAARPDAIVMHPGPVNRGVEIDSSVADGDRSLILQQVSHGIAVRMAVMAMILGNEPHSDLDAHTGQSPHGAA